MTPFRDSFQPNNAFVVEASLGMRLLGMRLRGDAPAGDAPAGDAPAGHPYGNLLGMRLQGISTDSICGASLGTGINGQILFFGDSLVKMGHRPLFGDAPAGHPYGERCASRAYPTERCACGASLRSDAPEGHPWGQVSTDRFYFSRLPGRICRNENIVFTKAIEGRP